jgi:SAM-dependent methyltransferase
MIVTRSKDGRANLHIWRTGESYFRQKGPVLLQEWTNLKFSLLPCPPGRSVGHHDIRKPLPFPDDTFDSVYALHVIEHLTSEEADRFVAEVFRVLRSGGIFRVSSPDLESAVRAYLGRLEECIREPTGRNVVRYDWAVLELLDQMVRNQSGGLMVEAIKREHFDAGYAQERFGDVFDEFYHPPERVGDVAVSPQPRQSLWEKLRSMSPAKLPHTLYWKLQNVFFGQLRRWKTRRLGGDPRKTKESNLWTYDRFSMRLLLEKRSFQNFSVKNHAESDIIGWEQYQLDRSNLGGHAIEPSLYVEAKKRA